MPSAWLYVSRLITPPTVVAGGLGGGPVISQFAVLQWEGHMEQVACGDLNPGLWISEPEL